MDHEERFKALAQSRYDYEEWLESLPAETRDLYLSGDDLLARIRKTKAGDTLNNLYNRGNVQSAILELRFEFAAGFKEINDLQRFNGTPAQKHSRRKIIRAFEAAFLLGVIAGELPTARLAELERRVQLKQAKKAQDGAAAHLEREREKPERKRDALLAAVREILGDRPVEQPPYAQAGRYLDKVNKLLPTKQKLKKNQARQIATRLLKIADERNSSPSR